MTLPTWDEICREMADAEEEARPEGAQTLAEWAAHFHRHETNVRVRLTALVAKGLWERLEGRRRAANGSLHPCVWWRPKAP